MRKRNNTERIQDAISTFRRASVEADTISGMAAVEWHKFDWKYVADWMDIQLKHEKETSDEH